MKLNHSKKLIVIIALIFASLGWYYFAIQKETTEAPTVSEDVFLPAIQATTTSEIKTYRNEEWGFEFWYPDEWEIKENIYRSPTSKFNLIIVPSQEKYLPDPILVNITIPEFVSRAFSDLKDIITEAVVGGIVGKKYEYEFESMQRISIILPFGEHQMILGTEKRYEDIFNQIISSFKFLEIEN